MRRLYTWGVVLWAIAWLFLPPNTEPDVANFWWLGGLGTLLILLGGIRSTGTDRWSLRALIPAAGLALFAWWWFDTIYIGVAILAAGAFVLAVAGSNRWGWRLGDGLLTAGTVALLQLVGYYLYIVYLGPRGHGAAIPTALLSAGLQLCGVNASGLADGLHIMSADRLYQVAPTLNNMGQEVFIQIFVGLIGLTICGKRKFRGLLTGAFVIAIFALVRYAAIAIWDYTHEGMFGTFWRSSALAWTAWPIGFFLQGHLSNNAGADIPKSATALSRPAASRRLAVAIVATMIGVFALSAYEGYHPEGERKAGRMLIDELHSEWEWSDMAFDTVWYGQQSTYNFYCLAEYWDNFYQMDRGYDTLTPALLANYDILVLKVPTSPYSPAEIDAVYDWVSDGGGLMLIGEHTNVFGYATFLNPIATRFGQRFIADIVYDLRTGDLNLHHPPTVMPHPVAQNMPTMLWGGPCSVWGDLSARPICNGLSLKTLPADYTQRNFFPERTGHTGYRFGIFSLAMSTRCGKGRVVSFTDSTIWSNFFVFLPGKVELAMGLVEYINRREWFPYWRILAFVIGVGALFVGALAASGLRREGWVWLAACGLLTFAGSVYLVESVNAMNYPLPRPHRAFAQLNFESEHSRYFVPELRLARQDDKDFSTFYLWTQRVGIVPRKFPTLEESLAQPGGQIIIDPETPFDDNELSRLETFVERGGTLYILDTPLNKKSSSAPLMQRFGMSFDLRPIVLTVSTPQVVADVLWRSGGRVNGGDEVLIAAPDSTASTVLKRFGKGMVIACANSNVFERKTMGYTAMIPNPVQNAISQFEYRLMTYLNYPPKETAARTESPQTDGNLSE